MMDAAPLDYAPMILVGLASTLAVSALSLIVASILGLLVALAALGHSRPWRWLALAYAAIIRSLPDLVLMLAIFYGGQALISKATLALGFGYWEISPFAAGIATLGLIYGAYLGETFRGAFLAVPKGQAEAALAMGLRRRDILFRILIPQAIRHALPGFGNNWLVMVKASALVSIIGLDDMVHRASLATAATGRPFTFYATVALLYLAVSTLSILALRWLEGRFSLGIRKAVP
jgi:arginine/ornithine transport system permease protein